MLTTVTGKPIMATVGFRVDLDAYQKIIGRARKDGVTVSRLVRRITFAELGIELPEADRAEEKR